METLALNTPMDSPSAGFRTKPGAGRQVVFQQLAEIPLLHHAASLHHQNAVG